MLIDCNNIQILGLFFCGDVDHLHIVFAFEFSFPPSLNYSGKKKWFSFDLVWG